MGPASRNEDRCLTISTWSWVWASFPTGSTLRTCNEMRQRQSSWARHSRTIFKKLTNHDQSQPALLGSVHHHMAPKPVPAIQSPPGHCNQFPFSQDTGEAVETRCELRVWQTNGSGETPSEQTAESPKVLAHIRYIFKTCH